MAFLKFTLVIALSMVGVQSQTLMQGKVTAKIIPRGPSMDVDLSWIDVKCFWGSATYSIDIERENKRLLVVWNYDKDHFTIDGSSEKAHATLHFWTRFSIEVEYRCPFSSGSLGLIQFENIPGELLPVSDLNSTPARNLAKVTWQLDDSQNSATNVLVQECSAAHPDKCLHERELPIEMKSYTFAGLFPGRRRIAIVRLFAPPNYYSAARNITVQSLPPTDEEVPRVKDLKITVSRNSSESSDFKVSFTKPAKIPNGMTFLGVSALLEDNFDDIVFEGQRNSTFVIAEVKHFRSLIFKYSTVYQLNDEKIWSVENEIRFNTGKGTLPKPQIRRVMSIDESTALIEWKHGEKDGYDILFSVSWDEGKTKEFPASRKSYGVLEGLTPGANYTVTISAHVTYKNETSTSISDPVQLTMLPKGALTPKINLKEVVFNGIVITWHAIFPERPAGCSFETEVCLKRNPKICKHDVFYYWGSSPEGKLAFFPFQNQTVKASAKCNFYPDVRVHKESNVLEVVGTFKPSMVQVLRGRAMSQTSLEITFWRNFHEVEFIEGYEIRWRKEKDTVEKKARISGDDEPKYIIKNLEVGTVYNVTVVAFTSEENQAISGYPASGLFSTLLPTPDKVTNLAAAQKLWSRIVTVSWTPVTYSHGDLKYGIEVVCPSWRNRFTTKLTKYDVEMDAEHKDSCIFGVTAITDSPDQPRVTGDTETVNFVYESLEKPVKITVKGLEQNAYEVEVLAPESVKTLKVSYQIAFDEDSYKLSSENNTLTFENTTKDTEIEVRARICYKDLCSAATRLNFRTNVGRPGLVRNLEIATKDDTNIIMQWSKPWRPLGPIDGYMIEITDSETLENTKVTVKGNINQQLFDFDKQHVEYKIEIAAFNKNRYGDGKLVGQSLIRIHQTSGKQPPPPRIFNLKGSGVHRGVYWNVPTNPNFKISAYHVVATPLPKNEDTQNQLVLFSQNTPVFDSMLTQPILLFSSLKAFREYSLRISSCSEQKKETCGRSFDEFKFQTDPGHPSRLNASSVSQDAESIFISWTKPEDPAGPIDGYFIRYIDTELGQTPREKITVDRDNLHFKLTNLTQATQYLIHISAFNLDGNEAMESPVAVVYATTSSVSSRKTSMIVLGVFAALGAMIIVAVLYVRLRKHRFSDTRPLILTMKTEDLQGEVTHTDEVNL